MATPKYAVVALMFACTLLVSCVSQSTSRRCQAYDNSCSDCIQTPGCQWCSQLKASNSSNQHHCYSTAVKEDICVANNLQNPTNTHQILTNLPLTEKAKGSNENIVQLAPQKILVKLRKGEPYNITFRFRLATDYPADLYYLMDLSKSMEDDKKNLANLGSTLATTMRNLTSQFRLGFGSYVDKVVMPYANVHPLRINTPCKGCAPPYSFRNNLPLDADDTKFTAKVNQAPISGNVDSPEGGLDALLQAIVCKKQIGWRPQARRLLILSTDAKFHHAGDGRLAGIVTPHDGECHLDKNGEYTHYDKLDYPSISQIDKAARENQVNIIFAVSAYDMLYQTLSAQIAYSSQGLLDSRSSNVVELVKAQYNQISSEVKLSDNIGSIPGTPLAVRYFTRCLDGHERQASTCTGIKEGNEVEFTAQLEVLTVPTDGRGLQLNITTFQDTLTINVEIMAECDCEQQGAAGREEASVHCHKAGVMQCGVCECEKGNYGNNCQCSATTRTQEDSTQDLAQCFADPAQPEQCSGQGDCECGTCICKRQSLSGKYCECNEDYCIDSSTGGGSSSGMGGQNGGSNLCNGRGTCDCGECRCFSGWAGNFCDCPDEESCRMPGSADVCSNKGTCECGECVCSIIDDVLYTGRYCEECATCSTGKCNEFRDCVQCREYDSGPLHGEACRNCTIRPKALSSLDAQVNSGARLCTFLDESTGCDFNFTYEYRSNKQDYYIFAQSQQRCPEELDVLGVVMGVIGGVVAIGLLTLMLWKVLTTMHDRREFAKFEKERLNVRFGGQICPIYKPATGTFHNPSFAQTAQ